MRFMEHVIVSFKYLCIKMGDTLKDVSETAGSSGGEIETL